jgi:hypothetical protein
LESSLLVVVVGYRVLNNTCCLFVALLLLLFVVANVVANCSCSAIRILGGVLESLHCHTSDYTSGEGSGYVQKLQDISAGVMDALVQGMKRKGLSEASQRYGTRALHRCLQTGTCTRPSRNLAAPEEGEEGEEVEEVEEVEGNHEAGTGNMGSVETSQVVLEETTDATKDTTRKDDDEAPSATNLLLDFVPLLLSLLTASVDENVNGASGGASGVALADVRLHLSPELSLLHHVVVHGGSVECVLHGAMGVLGEVLACLNVALAVPTKSEGEGESEGEGGGGGGGGGALNGLLLANVVTAAECAIELLNVATSGDR